MGAPVFAGLVDGPRCQSRAEQRQKVVPDLSRTFQLGKQPCLGFFGRPHQGCLLEGSRPEFGGQCESATVERVAQAQVVSLVRLILSGVYTSNSQRITRHVFHRVSHPRLPD